MKIFAAFLLLAVAGAEISQPRQSSLAVLTKLREALPDFTATRDTIHKHVSEAKQNSSNVLNSFLLNALKIKMNSLQAILDLEAYMIAWGAKFDDNWCWENNIPKLESIMRWIGTDLSKCTMQLDFSATKIIGNVYAGFFKEETTIVHNYSLLDAFEKRNIINNPQSIDDAISKTIVGLSNSVPEFGSVITSFEQYLNGTLPVFSKCLDQIRNKFMDEIKLLKKETLLCVDELKQLKRSKSSK